jgi:CubicO group peptidase (beta-lactamase class C family)
MLAARGTLAGCRATGAQPAAAPGETRGDRAEVVVDGLVPTVQVRGAPPVRYRLTDRMAHYHVPGVSVAIAEGGAVVWARGFGVKEAGSRDGVTPTTLFQAGSISKPVTATATLRLVDQGKLSLDENVNAYMRSWQLPDNEFTAREKVTLRRILSHCSGTTVHGFPGYSANDALPTLQQVLDGATPANTQPVRVEFVPGTRSRYSGGGVTIEQLALEEVTGEAFPGLLQRLVLGPTGMVSSTFEQPLPPSRQRDASTAHDTGGAIIPGRFHVYPEMAAAGLWSTVRREGGKLVLAVPRLGIDSEVVFTSPTSLVALDGADSLSLETGDGGRVTALQFGPLRVPRL